MALAASTAPPPGPPGFQKIARCVGWSAGITTRGIAMVRPDRAARSSYTVNVPQRAGTFFEPNMQLVMLRPSRGDGAAAPAASDAMHARKASRFIFCLRVLTRNSASCSHADTSICNSKLFQLKLASQRQARRAPSSATISAALRWQTRSRSGILAQSGYSSSELLASIGRGDGDPDAMGLAGVLCKHLHLIASEFHHFHGSFCCGYMCSIKASLMPSKA